MNEYPRTDDEFEADDRPSTGLSPSVRAIVSDSVPPADRSVSVALCTAAGAAVAECDEDAVDRTLEPLTNAITSFEGYVRIRRDLLGSDKYDRAADRDAAVLASDYLHSATYAMVEEMPVSDGRAIELYRVLAECSTKLSTQFLAIGGGETKSDSDFHVAPAEQLAGTAAALGATAMGATGEPRRAIERYGRELTAALATHPSPTDELREAVVRVLSERSGDRAGRNDEATTIRYDEDRGAPIDDHCRRAREALEQFDGTLDRRAMSTDVGQSPVARLERATRIPFQDVATSDD